MKAARACLLMVAILWSVACGGGGGGDADTVAPETGSDVVADTKGGEESGGQEAGLDHASPDAEPGEVPGEDVGATDTAGDLAVDASSEVLPPPDPGAEESGEVAGEVVVPDPEKAVVFDEGAVNEFHLTFAPDQWAQFLAYREAGEKEDVHCSFRFGDEEFPDAACRPKGNPLYWKDEKKPQFIIRFNVWDPDGRFRGLRRLMLEASPFHAAPVRDRLGMWLAREAGLDASRTNHVRLFIDGNDYGPYMNIEALDHEFIEDHWGEPIGNLYEEGYKLKTNEDVEDLSRLLALNDLVKDEPLDGDHATFFAALDALVDIDQVLLEMAVEVLLSTPDNFSNGSSNFYYYDHPTRGFMVLPWDLDDVLGEAPVDSDLYEYWGPPDWGNPPNKMRQLINQNPAWRQQFEDNLVTVRDGPYAKLAARAALYCAQVRPLVEADPYKCAPIEDFDADCAAIQAHIAARAEHVKQVLGR